MTSRDPLWDPTEEGDDDLQALETALQPIGVRARAVPVRWRKGRRVRVWPFAAAATVACLAVLGSIQYRLSWVSGDPWQTSHAGPLSVGQSITVVGDQPLDVRVARIGRLSVSKGSQLDLVQTRAGGHVVRLERGHLRARIWAPPGFFSAQVGDATIVDLGCEFDLWQGGGAGRVLVRSGWVSYRLADEDILVPAGYQLTYRDGQARSPMRPRASPDLIRATARLDAALARGANEEEVDALSAQAAGAMTKDDAFTALSLLTRFPKLARTELYPALAQALGTQPSLAHRQAWSRGSQQAMDAWWQKMPVQPKAWWRNWRDAWA